MEDQYGMADIRDYMNGRSLLPAFPPPGDLFSGHHRTTPTHHHQQQHFDMLMVGRGSSGHQVNSADVVSRGLHHQHQEFRSADSASATTGGVDVSINGLDMEVVGGGCGGDGSGTGRWPRQETLTLLEVRSMLDSKFKEANHKGPLWDEVSRIMSEEYGYQRSGKKCREKFENLYKYYKKTKEGKAGRQDGKHYRFFRQLEALYGDNTTPATTTTTTSHPFGNNIVYGFHHNTNQNEVVNHSEGIQQANTFSLSQSSDLSPCSSDDNTADLDDSEKMRRGRRSWKGKIKDFIELQMKKLMEKQEEWLEKMTKTLERKEQERMVREEEWRKQEAARVEREHKFWASERSWIEARDTALMEALHKFNRRETNNASSSEVVTGNNNENGSDTITNTWRAEESWLESINKKRSSESYNEQAMYNQPRVFGGIGDPNNGANSSAGNGLHDSCFRFFVGAEEPSNLWDSYGSKHLNKES